MTQTGDFFLLDPDKQPFATGASSTLPAEGQGCMLLLKGKPLPLSGTLVHVLYIDDRAYEAL